MSEISFGTDGWRAVIAEGFTFENVKIAGSSIGKYISKNHDKELPIVIGYDTRFLSEDFAKTCCSILSGLGLNPIISSKPVPTPVVAYWAAHFPAKDSYEIINNRLCPIHSAKPVKCDELAEGSPSLSWAIKTNGAIQFTASHNPPKYCGLKYITNYGGPAPVEITNEITEYVKGMKEVILKDASYNASTVIFEPFDHYFSHIKTLIDFEQIKTAKLKIVYDPLYGAGNGYLDRILKELGCEVITIHNKKDPMFGGLLPEPREENLAELKLVVKSSGAVLGIATDGDADRISIIDQKGIFYSPNQIASMLLRHLCKNKNLKGTVVRTLSTTHLMDHLAKKYNLSVVETKVGFKWICEIMRKEKVLIGAEESGGISILGHVPDKDAVLAGVLLSEMLAYENKSLSEIYKDTLNDAGCVCINDKLDLHMENDKKEKFISSLKSAKVTDLGGLKIKSINTTEGVKYLFDDGSWFMARASGTEPMARVYFEAASENSLKLIKNEVQRIIESIM